MRKVLIAVLAFALCLPAVGGAWTPGRDKQPVEVRGGESVTMDATAVTGYGEVAKTYSNVIKFEIYNASKSIRMGWNDVTTSDSYWVIPSTALGYESGAVDFDSFTLRLMGDSATDTATVRVIIYHKDSRP